MTTVLFCGRK